MVKSDENSSSERVCYTSRSHNKASDDKRNTFQWRTEHLKIISKLRTGKQNSGQWIEKSI